MHKIIFLFLKSLTLVLLFITNLYTEELTIIPIKKPVLDKVTEQQKITQGIIRPKIKPIKKKENQKLTKDSVKPKPKPIKKIDEIKTEVVKEIEVTQDKVVKKEKVVTVFLTPKSKPLLVKKVPTTKKTRSKYYSQRDFDIARKSIQAIEKLQWSSALSLSKKAKDKTIHNFIQWRHLLTTGNQASFYDYLAFIKNNENYPRINRIRYLAEHKLSTDKISPKKNNRLV